MPYRIAFFTLLAVALTGWYVKAEFIEDADAAEVAQPHITTDAIKVVELPYEQTFLYTTRLEAPKNVELRSRVSGIIDKVLFREGHYVNRGDVLFQLDNRQFLAEVQRLESEYKKASVILKQTLSEAQRAQILQNTNAIPVEQAEQRLSQVGEREAELNSIMAQLEIAKLNLDYTEVRAPISGKVSNAYVTEGNYVQAGTTTLTSLVSTKVLQAYFDVDERTWNTRFSQIKPDSQTPVEFEVSGEEIRNHKGSIDFIDNRVNSAAGTLRIRAQFENDDDMLRPGSFGRIRLGDNQGDELKVMIPDKSIGTDLANRFVFIIDKSGVVKYRKIEIGDRIGSMRIVSSGLQAGETVVLNGPAKVRAEMTVVPNLVSLDERLSLTTAKN